MNSKEKPSAIKDGDRQPKANLRSTTNFYKDFLKNKIKKNLI